MRAGWLVVILVLLPSRALADPPQFLTCQSDCRAEERRCVAKCNADGGARNCALDCRAGVLDCRSNCVCAEIRRQHGEVPDMCRGPSTH